METFDSLLNVSAVPKNDEKAAFVARSKNERNRCYALSEKMTEQVAADGKAFQDYLDIQSRFLRYSPNNVLLIMAQNPDATRLGDYGFWRDREVYVKRQERDNPILILEPGKEYTKDDGTKGTYYNAKRLYDVSQTNMRKEKTETEKITDEELVAAVVSEPAADIRVAEKEQLPPKKGAFFDKEDNCIYVRGGMDGHEIFRCLTPELVHAGFADGNPDYKRGDYSFYAYCASYLLCKKYGIETGDFDFSVSPEFFQNMELKEVRKELRTVWESAAAISGRMEKAMEKNRPKNRQKEPEKEKPESHEWEAAR